MPPKNLLISINELCKDPALNTTRSKLLYYCKFGLLKPKAVVGRMFIMELDYATKRIKEIDKLRKSGLTLAEIKDKFDKCGDN